jgi:hypothetical protein
MRKFIFSLLLIVLIHPISSDSLMASSEEIEGKNLHLRILARHSKLDKFYQLPDLFGGLTNSPKVTIYIPIVDWEKMTSREQDLLAAYASSLIKTVQSNPLKYARIPENAPAAQQIRSNAMRIGEKSWQILGGELSSDGRDIMADSTLRAGTMIAIGGKEVKKAPDPKVATAKPMSKHNTDILARKLAVAIYYEEILKKEYTMAVVSVQGNKEEILQVSLIRVTDDRCNSILRSGLYNDAKKAKFRRIVFVDINQEEISFEIK